MSNKNISETLCEAVDIIAQARAKQVSSDQTILCTITNDTLKDKGQYKVSNGSTEFYAYTQITDYKNNDNVYVQIPMGDWNAQKFIIGKKTNQDTSEFFTYKNPFNNLVDITGNIINSNVPTGESALVANNPEETSVVLWTYNIPKEITNALRMERGPSHSGYTRLGLQASFQAALNPFNYKEYEYDENGIALDENKLKIVKSQATSNVIDGEYGLRLHLKVTRSQTLTQNKDAGQEKTQDVILELNTQNMNGNPYNFNSFFQQEVVYHIEEYESIEQISIEFYQKDGSFVDAYGHALPHKDDFGRLIVPNLYVKDIYLCLGYDVREFDDEMIKIYTLDTTTYSRKTEPLTDNVKKIQLRWIHKMPDGSFKSIDRDDIDDYNFKIQWYRYSLGSPSSDIYSGKEYQHLSYEEWDNGKCYREIEDKDWINNNLIYEKKLYPGFFYTYLLPDVDLSTEMIKAVLLFNGKPIRSNIITLTNENEVVSRYTIDVLEALMIHCNNGLDEAGNPIYSNNYLIYNQGNELIDESQAKKPRKFELTFNPEVPTNEDETEGLKFARYVEWRIPRKNTMITLPSGYDDHNAIVDEKNPEYYLIRRNGVYNNQDKNYRVYAKQSFMIDGYYSAEKFNNTVQCTIEKEPNTFYVSTVDLLFGVAGTTGTDATLVLSFEDTSLAAINASTTGDTNIIARLYDAKNEDITQIALQKNCTFEWKWKGSNVHKKLKLIEDTEEKFPSNYCIIQNDGTEELTEDEWNILECTLIGWGDYPLIAYFAIPFCQDPTESEYRTLYMEGASKVIYNADGTPSYYKNPYKLYYVTNEKGTDQDGNAIVNSVINNYLENNDGLEDYGIYWKVSPNLNYWKNIALTDNKISTYERYVPKIILEVNRSTGYKENKGLQPLALYVRGADDYITLNCIDTTGRILWSQPLLILQNRYPSSMINSWDGQLKVDETENAIMAAKIAAGTKDEMNRFSGVMLGDWSYKSEGSEESDEQSLKETGLYGFHEGAMSFGFKETGKAFIGKDGRGRIHFDGNEGAIYSSEWTGEKNSLKGLKLDIDDGNISMRYTHGDVNVPVYVQTSINDRNFSPNSFYGFQKYVVANKYDPKITDYYVAYGFKPVNVDKNNYVKNVYYYRQEVPGKDAEGEEIKVTEYVLDSSENIQPNVDYYYVSYFSRASTQPTAETDFSKEIYYIQNELTLDINTGQIAENSLISKDDNRMAHYRPYLIYYKKLDVSPNKYIDIATTSHDADYQNIFPLSIGYADNVSDRAFRVSWDGTIHVENGEFNGEIHATSGTLGDLEVTGTLVGGTIYGGNISGTWINGSTIEGSEVYADYLTCYNGDIAGWRITESFLRNSTSTIMLYSDGSRKVLARFGGWQLTKLGFENYEDNTSKNSYSYIDGGVFKGSVLETDLSSGTDLGGMLLVGQFQLGYVDTKAGDSMLNKDTGYAKYTKLPGFIGYVPSDLFPSSIEDQEHKEAHGIGVYYKGDKDKDKISQIKATAKNAGLRHGVENYISAEAESVSIGSLDGKIGLTGYEAINQLSKQAIILRITDIDSYGNVVNDSNGNGQVLGAHGYGVSSYVKIGHWAEDHIMLGPVKGNEYTTKNATWKIWLGDYCKDLMIGNNVTSKIEIGNKTNGDVKIGASADIVTIGGETNDNRIINIGENTLETINIGVGTCAKIELGGEDTVVNLKKSLVTSNIFIGESATNYQIGIIQGDGVHIQNGANFYVDGSADSQTTFNIINAKSQMSLNEGSAIVFDKKGTITLPSGDLTLGGDGAELNSKVYLNGPTNLAGEININSGTFKIADGVTCYGIYATLA